MLILCHCLYGIQAAMKYYFSSDNHILSLAVAPLNGYYSVIFTDIATYIAGTSYSGHRKKVLEHPAAMLQVFLLFYAT